MMMQLYMKLIEKYKARQRNEDKCKRQMDGSSK